MITDELRDYVTSCCEAQALADVRIGLGYTAVRLADGNVGLAYTFHADAAAGCSVFTGMRPLAGRKTSEVIAYLGSKDNVESSVGMAVANAVTNRPSSGQSEGDVLEALGLRPEDRVGMVGYFGPLVAPIEERAAELTIFERNAARSDRVLPAEEALEHLPSCDVAVITSTALILGEMDGLLEATAGCREVALVGASTPLAPAVFAAQGVTLLSGVTVTDTDRILQIVSEGGGMGLFGKAVCKVNMRI